jgi:hypothetical protein
VSIFWVHASSVDRFRHAYESIAQEYEVPGYHDAKADVLSLVRKWLERQSSGRWLMVIDNADDKEFFFSDNASSPEGNLGAYIPECRHGYVLVTTRNKQAGLDLTRGMDPIEVKKMGSEESTRLFRTKLNAPDIESDELATLASRLENLPLALVQATSYIQANQ